MSYIFSTWNCTYYLDDAFTIKAQKNHNSSYELMNGLLLDSEKEFFEKDSGAQFCNKKNDVAYIRDAKILGRIIAATQSQQISSDIQHYVVSKQLQSAVTWDLLVIQAIRSIDEIDKSINLLSKRLREWFEWECPEVSKRINSHETLAKKIVQEELEDSEIGKRLSEIDHKPIRDLAEQITTLAILREKNSAYIEEVLIEKMPNTYALVGSQIAAKLLSLSGDIYRMAMFTSSTIQVLGAEKALFRHLKTGARPPKYGVIFQHNFVARAKNRGRAARVLANSLSITIKADYFGSDSAIGEKLKQKNEALKI